MTTPKQPIRTLTKEQLDLTAEMWRETLKASLHKIPHLRPMSERPDPCTRQLVFRKNIKPNILFTHTHGIANEWKPYAPEGLPSGLLLGDSSDNIGWCYPEDLELPPPPPELPEATTGRELCELAQEYAAAGKCLNVRLVHKTPGVDVAETCLATESGCVFLHDVVTFAYWLDQNLATVEVLPDDEGGEG